MGNKTGISWTEATWNPIRGCVRVSEGCRFCYAESVAARFSGPGQPYEGLAVKVQTPKGPDSRWTGKAALIDHALDLPLRWSKPRMIFVNSMSDLFFDQIPTDFVDRIVAVMALSRKHTFQVLTKRARRMREYLNDPALPGRIAAVIGRDYGASKVALEWFDNMSWPLANVWWGVSAENQAAANERIPALLDARAALRFVSYEPALGPIDFSAIRQDADTEPYAHYMIDALRGGIWDEETGHISTGGADIPALDWIIVGGESHADWKRARPFDLEWAAAVVRDAADTNVAVYVKQLGSNPVTSSGSARSLFGGGKTDDPSIWPESLQVQEYPGGVVAR